MSPTKPGPEFCRLHLAAIAQNGYHPFPIPPAQKRTHWSGWMTWCRIAPRSDQIARWTDKQGHYGIALACGHACIAIDIDDENEDRGTSVQSLAFAVFGETPLVRFGRFPRRVLLYRVVGPPIVSRKLAPTIDLIAAGKYVLAHGIHPGTLKPYTWQGAGPESCALIDLPAADEKAITAFAETVRGYYGLTADETPYSAALAPHAAEPSASSARSKLTARKPGTCRASRAKPDARWVTDESGRVCDGREAFLSAQVYRAWCDGHDDVCKIADVAWAWFTTGADLARPRRDGSRPWQRKDALTVASALLRRNKPRPARHGASRHGLWTPSLLATFRHVVNERGALGGLPPAAVRVSHAMLGYIHGDNTCFASPGTLAADLKLSERAVKQARKRLVEVGLWQVSNNKGGRSRGADYAPNPDVLSFASTERVGGHQNSEQNTHPSLPVGRGVALQDGAGVGLLEKKRNNAGTLRSLCSRGASPKYRDIRGLSTAIDVGDVPHGPLNANLTPAERSS